MFKLFYILFEKINFQQRYLCYLAIFLITFQIIIGVLTLIYNVPIYLASLHQANATLLICSLLANLYLFSKG